MKSLNCIFVYACDPGNSHLQRIRSNRCVCVCPTGYTGQSCETSTMNACNQFSPCQNGSRFTILPKGYNCSCANGFTCTDRIIRTPAASVMTAITTSSTSASFRIVTSMNMITTAVATQTVTTSANASVAFASAVNSIYISATDAINNNFNCTVSYQVRHLDALLHDIFTPALWAIFGPMVHCRWA